MADKKPPEETDAEILERLRKYAQEAKKGLFSEKDADFEERGIISGSPDLCEKAMQNYFRMSLKNTSRLKESREL